MILALEASTPVCSVALQKTGRTVIEKRMEGKGVHSERTFLFIRELLERHHIGVNDLDAILFSNGPGSYTGLRIGTAAIKGLLFRQNVPLYTLPTLTSFAVPFLNTCPVTIHAVIDARREHLYRQKIDYPAESEITVTGPEVKKLADLEAEIHSGDIVVGTGWDRLKPQKRGKIRWFGTEAVSAKNLIQAWNHPLLASRFQSEEAERFEPNYLTMAQVNNTPVS